MKTNIIGDGVHELGFDLRYLEQIEQTSPGYSTAAPQKLLQGQLDFSFEVSSNTGGH